MDSHSETIHKHSWALFNFYNGIYFGIIITLPKEIAFELNLGSSFTLSSDDIFFDFYKQKLYASYFKQHDWHQSPRSPINGNWTKWDESPTEMKKRSRQIGICFILRISQLNMSSWIILTAQHNETQAPIVQTRRGRRHRIPMKIIIAGIK